MDLKKRFFLYGFGFAMGAIIVLFIWSKKEATFDYSPNARVIKNILSKTLNNSVQSQEIIQQFQLDSVQLSDLIKNGKVNFQKSDTQKKGCKSYWILTVFKEDKMTLLIDNCDSVAIIQQIIIE